MSLSLKLKSWSESFIADSAADDDDDDEADDEADDTSRTKGNFAESRSDRVTHLRAAIAVSAAAILSLRISAL